MTSQIFKKNVPTELLIKLFNDVAFKTETFYIIDFNAFKKGIFNDLIPEFINNCIPYYHLSKRKYLERQLTYNSFITVIRQICKFNQIQYETKIKYDKSNYEIVYYIYLSQPSITS